MVTFRRKILKRHNLPTGNRKTKDAKEASNENGKVGIARTEPNRVSAAWVDLAGLVNLTTNPPPKKWPALLLMAEIGRSPVELGSLSHYY